MTRANHGWHTPDSLAGDEICRPLFIPGNESVLAIVGGALSELTKLWNYEQVGEITPAEISELMTSMLARWYSEECDGTGNNIQTPFWDDVGDTDDEAPPAEQTWYGEVDDPLLPPGELTFIENAGIWAFTGLLAVAGLPAAAIAFQTTAPSFVLAMRGDSFAEVIRILVDGEDAVTVETSGDPDELFEIPVFPDPDISVHDILIILRELL